LSCAIFGLQLSKTLRLEFCNPDDSLCYKLPSFGVLITNQTKQANGPVLDLYLEQVSGHTKQFYSLLKVGLEIVTGTQPEITK
jgi:hypothetical protein